MVIKQRLQIYHHELFICDNYVELNLSIDIIPRHADRRNKSDKLLPVTKQLKCFKGHAMNSLLLKITFMFEISILLLITRIRPPDGTQSRFSSRRRQYNIIFVFVFLTMREVLWLFFSVNSGVDLKTGVLTRSDCRTENAHSSGIADIVCCASLKFRIFLSSGYLRSPTHEHCPFLETYLLFFKKTQFWLVVTSSKSNISANNIPYFMYPVGNKPVFPLNALVYFLISLLQPIHTHSMQFYTYVTLMIYTEKHNLMIRNLNASLSEGN